MLAKDLIYFADDPSLSAGTLSHLAKEAQTLSMSIDDLKFQIGFWHPFGPHAGESAEEIITRKRHEIEKNSWTIWSFQFRKTLRAGGEKFRRRG